MRPCDMKTIGDAANP